MKQLVLKNLNKKYSIYKVFIRFSYSQKFLFSIIINKYKELLMERSQNNELLTNLYLEQIILGIIINNNDAYDLVSSVLKSEMFYYESHQYLCTCIAKLLQDGHPVDFTTLYPYIYKARDIHNIDMKYIEDLTKNTYGETNLIHYVSSLRDLYLKRNLMTVLEDAKVNILNYDISNTVEKNIEKIEQSFVAMLDNPQSKKTELLSTVVRRCVMALNRNNKFSGLDTGFSSINQLLGGLQKGELVVIAGRPSMGKTAFAANLCMNVAKNRKNGGNVLFFSLEMPAEQITLRLLSAETKINSFAMRSGNISDRQIAILREKSKELDSIPFFMDDTALNTLSNIRTKSRRIKRIHGLDLIVIDYLQLITSERSFGENRAHEVATITQGLKQIAKDLSLNVIALSQLSRAVETREDKRPQLSDLRESGAIEQDADVVMFIYREEYYLSRKEPKVQNKDEWLKWKQAIDECANSAEIIIDKNRNGSIGAAKVGYDIPHSFFYDLHMEAGENLS